MLSSSSPPSDVAVVRLETTLPSLNDVSVVVVVAENSAADASRRRRPLLNASTAIAAPPARINELRASFCEAAAALTPNSADSNGNEATARSMRIHIGDVDEDRRALDAGGECGNGKDACIGGNSLLFFFRGGAKRVGGERPHLA